MLNNKELIYDYLIVGAGIIGLTVAYELKKKDNALRICIIDKEKDLGKHASAKNSGILHAGFYYSSETNKAKHCLKGNLLMKQFCKDNEIPVKETGKLVVPTNKEELLILYELKKRADKNEVPTVLISQKEAEKIEPNINAYKECLYSPITASVNPEKVLNKLKVILEKQGVEFYFNTSFNKNKIKHTYLINCAGMYADKIAQSYGLASRYTILPFKGKYVKVISDLKPVNINIYPVPDLRFPFLGEHYTITANDEVLIGPSAIPSLWREHYTGVSRFVLKEFIQILLINFNLFFFNAIRYRKLIIRELKKLNVTKLAANAEKMIKHNGQCKYEKKSPGIRAQLYDKIKKELVDDFIIKHSENSTHVLNIISPGFTCSFSLAQQIVEEVIDNKKNGKKKNKLLVSL